MTGSISKGCCYRYERCFVELYMHIQAKLQETRKYFATYNALAEANELTLKEISLLNSINVQVKSRQIAVNQSYVFCKFPHCVCL